MSKTDQSEQTVWRVLKTQEVARYGTVINDMNQIMQPRLYAHTTKINHKSAY